MAILFRLKLLLFISGCEFLSIHVRNTHYVWYCAYVNYLLNVVQFRMPINLLIFFSSVFHREVRKQKKISSWEEEED